MNKILVVGAVAAVFLLSGTAAPVAAKDTYDPKIVAAAKKEGQVVVYHSANRQVVKKLCSTFQKKFGIKAHCTRKSTGGVIKTFTAENMVGQHRCDIISVGDPGSFLTWKEKKQIQPYHSVNRSKVRKDLVDPSGYFHTVRLTYFGISYSTKKISAAEAPKDWDDIFQKKWVGKIGVVNPRTSGPSRLWLAGIVKRYGWDYIKKLSKMKPLMIKSSSTAAKLLIRGEVSIIVPGSEHSVTKRKSKKQPVGMVYPKSGLMGKASWAAICAHAPHLNAAKLWIDFETSKQGQTIMTKVGAYPPTREDVEIGFKKIRGAPKVYKKENSNWVTPQFLQEKGPAERKKFEKIMKAGMGL